MYGIPLRPNFVGFLKFRFYSYVDKTLWNYAEYVTEFDKTLRNFVIVGAYDFCMTQTLKGTYVQCMFSIFFMYYFLFFSAHVLLLVHFHRAQVYSTLACSCLSLCLFYFSFLTLKLQAPPTPKRTTLAPGQIWLTPTPQHHSQEERQYCNSISDHSLRKGSKSMYTTGQPPPPTDRCAN
jgi:hypothetical protein